MVLAAARDDEPPAVDRRRRLRARPKRHRGPSATWDESRPSSSRTAAPAGRTSNGHPSRRRRLPAPTPRQMLADGLPDQRWTGQKFELWHRDDPARPTLECNRVRRGTGSGRTVSVLTGDEGRTGTVSPVSVRSRDTVYGHGSFPVLRREGRAVTVRRPPANRSQLRARSCRAPTCASSAGSVARSTRSSASSTVVVPARLQRAATSASPTTSSCSSVDLPRRPSPADVTRVPLTLRLALEERPEAGRVNGDRPDSTETYQEVPIVKRQP